MKRSFGFHRLQRSTLSRLILASLLTILAIPALAQAPRIYVSVADVTQQDVDRLALGSTDGAIVTHVQLGVSVFDTELQRDDVIVELDGSAVVDAESLRESIGELQVGQSVELSVIRKGETTSVSLVLGGN